MSLKKQAIAGVRWSTISTVILAVAQLLKISVLTRFLSKSDFGLMAIVVFVMGITNLFVDLGLTSAILHKQNIEKDEFSSLYWLNIAISIVFFIFLLGIAPFIAAFYIEPELESLLPLMSITILLSSFGRQFRAIEQKGLNFIFISIVDIFSAVLSLLFAVVLACHDYGVYALVYSALLLNLISNIAFFVRGMNRVGLRRHFVFRETEPFLRIGLYQVGGQIMNYISRDFDILMIGKFFGAEALGGYSLAKQVVSRPTQVINPILTSVAAPVFARLNDKLTHLRSSYLKLVNIISTMNFAIYLLIFLFADQIIICLYGSNYLGIVTIVRILCGFMFLRSIGNPVGSLLVATGRTDLDFWWNLLSLCIFPVVLVISCQYTFVVVTLALTSITLLLILPAWYVMIRAPLRVSLLQYLKSLVPSIGSSWRIVSSLRK